MVVAFSVVMVSAGLLLAAWFLRGRSGLRSGLRAIVVAVLALAGLAVWAPARVDAATGSTLFFQTFANNTLNAAYPVSLPALPSNSSGTNYACLTAAGVTTGSPKSCPTANDVQGSGKLRLTAASGGLTGGVFAATSVPTSQGLDATFNTYQYGGNGADGITFALAAVNPANPLSPATIGPSGGSLGYSAFGGLSGLADAYMGIGLDEFGNFSNSVY